MKSSFSFRIILLYYLLYYCNIFLHFNYKTVNNQEMILFFSFSLFCLLLLCVI